MAKEKPATPRKQQAQRANANARWASFRSDPHVIALQKKREIGDQKLLEALANKVF